MEQTRWSKRLATGHALPLVAANGLALGQLIILLTDSGSGDGRTLLFAALQIWVTSVSAFALVSWELDGLRTGRKAEHPPG